MKILIDTNIAVHREADAIVHKDIGFLFQWIDNLHYKKYIHPVTLTEITHYKDDKTVKKMVVKLGNYNVIKTNVLIHPDVKKISDAMDTTDNDFNDTILLNEVYRGHIDILITEDRKIHTKAEQLGISDKIFTIDTFLEKVVSENPQFVDYSVLAVKKEYFGNINLQDGFFDSFKRDYAGYENWFRKKSEDIAYICKTGEKIIAFLYLKVEGESEPYGDIQPTLAPKKRLKIGTFKVTLNGYKLGERFLKIVFDNALRFDIEEIYITIFNKGIEQERLICLLEDFGFEHYGYKTSASGKELVYVRQFERRASNDRPKLTYPFSSARTNKFIVPIYPSYHTNLFPDSILRTESPNDFVEIAPYRNAISKVYVSRSIEKGLRTGDLVIFYRTGGYYKSVVTTLGIVENVITDIKNQSHFIGLCRKRSVFSDRELTEQWTYSRSNKPFIVNFLYAYSFPKRINLKKLIEIGVISDVKSAPRGFEKLTDDKFKRILKETESDESIIID